MRWLELSVEADVEAVEAVSEILGRIAAGTAVQPTRLIRDPDDELAAREDPTAPYVSPPTWPRRPTPRTRSRPPSGRCGISRRSACDPSARCASATVDDADWIDAVEASTTSRSASAAW